MKWSERIESAHVQGGIIALTLLGVILLSAFGRPAAPLAISGVSILLLLRFGVISNLIVKAFGAEVAITRAEEVTKEAEEATKGAQEATEKAEAAIEELKTLSWVLASLSVLEMALNNDGDEKSTVGTYRILSRHLTNLDPDLGEGFQKTLKRPIIFRFVMNAVRELPKTESYLQLMEDVTDVIEIDPIDLVKVKTLFRQFEMSDNAEKWLDMAEQFQATGRVKFDNVR